MFFIRALIHRDVTHILCSFVACFFAPSDLLLPLETIRWFADNFLLHARPFCHLDSASTRAHNAPFRPNDDDDVDDNTLVPNKNHPHTYSMDEWMVRHMMRISIRHDALVVVSFAYAQCSFACVCVCVFFVRPSMCLCRCRPFAFQPFQQCRLRASKCSLRNARNFSEIPIGCFLPSFRVHAVCWFLCFFLCLRFSYCRRVCRMHSVLFYAVISHHV